MRRPGLVHGSSVFWAFPNEVNAISPSAASLEMFIFVCCRIYEQEDNNFE
jgi:hypothetical protein